ncbi:sensor histidine kinase [Ralstonia sp. VS2407]
MEDLNELKQLLSVAANDAKTDFERILALANEVAKRDPNNVRFSVDASHISRLGLELVAKQETAVAELIKNAYDADATLVDLVFKGTDSKGGVLEIIDNGHGMSREQLVDGFMRISTQSKALQPVSEKYVRQRAGRKGIGRFATQRLGTRLVIRTQLESSTESLQLDIDWNLFEGGRDLYLVSNQIVVCERMATPGTTLRIEGLRDAWSEAQVRRAFRYVSELLQPFPISEAVQAGSNEDPGFKVAFYREQDGDLTTIADEEQSIYAHSYAIFSGNVDENGCAYVSIDSKKYNIEEEDIPLEFEQKLKLKTGLNVESYDELSGIKFKAYYFIQDELPSGTKSMVRDILNRQGGIRIYRNGFRVLPYGETFDDWLGLQRSSALRELLPPHHNHNFLGFVEIVDVAGKRFEETASREGLLENEAFIQLQDFVYRGLMQGVIRLARARGKKIFSSDAKKQKKKDDDGAKEEQQEEPSPLEKAESLAARLRAALEAVGAAGHAEQDDQERDDEPSDRPFSESPEDLNAIAEEIEQLGQESQGILEENGMLRVLASLGLTIGEFTHEVRHALAGLNATIQRMEHEGVSSEALSASKENVFLLQSYVRYFDNAIAQNAHRKLETHELRDLVGEFSEVIRPTLVRQGIKLRSEFDGYDLFTKPMHRSEWSSVLLNLFTNSLKAIHRAGVKGEIFISGKESGDFLYLDFCDNGDGVPPENEEKIFDAFFTTSAPPSVLSSDSEKLVGTGLGLKIVRDIIDAANGDIYIVEPPPGYSTCFRIEIPRANDEEIGDARY